eukprot:sb/3474420/
MDHWGPYKCQGYYFGVEPVDTKNSTVEYLYVRGFDLEPVDTFSKIGAVVSLSCIVRGDQKAVISWHYSSAKAGTYEVAETGESEDSYDDSTKSTNSKLKFPSASDKSSGYYKCAAYWGSDTASIQYSSPAVLRILSK